MTVPQRSSREYVEGLDQCWTSFDTLVAGLTEQQWRTPSLCTGWTVRDVVSHIGSVEHMLRGQAPGSMAEAIPFHKAVEWSRDATDLDNAALFERCRQVIAARRIELADVTDADLALPALTPVGPGTFGRWLAIRVFDCWVHEQDIRVPLGIGGNEGGSAAELAIDEIERSLPYIVGKLIGLPDGKSMTIEIDGPVRRSMHVVVAGRAGTVDLLDAPDVVLRTDSTTFALLACGRIDPQGPIDDGRIGWTGDETWGEAAARNLAFTM